MSNNWRNYKTDHVTGLHILFGLNVGDWKYDADKLCYITPFLINWQVSKMASLIYGNGELLWDMFGGIGTDSIQFSIYFNIITSELDKITYELLRSNILKYKIKNVNIMNINCFELLGLIEPNVIYYDPPWGIGYKPKMKNYDFSQVFLEYPDDKNDIPKKVSCTDLILYIYENICKNIIIKSPLNSNSYELLFKEKIYYILKCPYKNLKFVYLIDTSK